MLGCVTKLLSVDVSAPVIADQMEPFTILLEFLSGLLRHCKAVQSDKKQFVQKSKQHKPDTKKQETPTSTPMDEDKPSLQASQTLTQSQDLELAEDDEELNEIDEEAEIDVDDNAPESENNAKDNNNDSITTTNYSSSDGQVDETEKDLASKMCTYTVSQNTFMEQHWYYCYTCNLTFSEGR